MFVGCGIDSSTIAAMMARQSADPVPVFSIGVEEQAFNELPFARMVVDRYGLEGHEKVVRADLIHLIPTMIRHMDEPADPFGMGVARNASSRISRVPLSRNGAPAKARMNPTSRIRPEIASGSFTTICAPLVP